MFTMNVLTVRQAVSTYDLLCCLLVTIRGLVGRFNYSTAERRVTRVPSPTPFMWSAPAISRVPYTSATCLLCVSNDSQSCSRKTAPSPSSLFYSLTHSHRSIGYHNIPQPLTDSVTRLIYLRVYDSRASSSKPVLFPSSLFYSFTHSHRSIGYCNIRQSLTDSVARLIYLRVYGNRASSSKLAPSPSCLFYSLTHSHRPIGYHNIPQPLADSEKKKKKWPSVILPSGRLLHANAGKEG
jgi:hypothetical protein